MTANDRKPTQAQIEAALRDLYEDCRNGPATNQSMRKAKAALTAAAEAKPNPLDLEHEWFSKGWNDAIERCAQVADATGGNGYAIAAEIRALKEDR